MGEQEKLPVMVGSDGMIKTIHMVETPIHGLDPVGTVAQLHFVRIGRGHLTFNQNISLMITAFYGKNPAKSYKIGNRA